MSKFYIRQDKELLFLELPVEEEDFQAEVDGQVVELGTIMEVVV